MIKWTDEKIQFMREHYKKMSDEELSEHLGMSARSIQNKRNYLGLYCDEFWWTPDEVLYVQSHYLTCNDAEIGEALGRTAQSIRARRKKMGLVNMRAPIRKPRGTARKRKRTWKDYRPSFIPVEPLDALVRQIEQRKQMVGTYGGAR